VFWILIHTPQTWIAEETKLVVVYGILPEAIVKKLINIKDLKTQEIY